MAELTLVSDDEIAKGLTALARADGAPWSHIVDAGMDLDAVPEPVSAFTKLALEQYRDLAGEVLEHRARAAAGLEKMLGAFELVQGLLDNPRLNAPAVAELKGREEYLRDRLRRLGVQMPGDRGAN